jgi:rhodanese-related sulfurtransferase
MVTRIDVDRVMRLVGRGAQLVDVLPAAMYQREHLPSAISLPLASFSDDTIATLDLARPVVVYCFDQH